MRVGLFCNPLLRHDSLICRCRCAHHFLNSLHTLNCHPEPSEGPAFQSAAAEFKYLALIPPVAFSSESSDRTIGNCTLRCASASSTFSVGILPTSSSCANGHPPNPPMAESNRRQPASYAARTLSTA